MLRLPRKAALALEAVLDIAYNGRQPVQSREITGRQGVPDRYLEQTLQRLVREGVLKGVRGPRGGYTLARDRGTVTLGQVVRVLDAVDAEEDGPSTELGARVLGPLWLRVQAEILARLDAVTLDDLCREARAKGCRRADGTAGAP
jgi:Rrf2 family protein